jgi:glutamine amidotransferase
MNKIVIINTGSSNLLSLKRAIELFDQNVVISDNADQILSASRVFFPGVGAFKRVMDNLIEKKIVDILLNIKKKEIPLLGICLGLQLMFDNSQEFGNNKGLGLINGDVNLLPNLSIENKKIKVPNIEWVKLIINKKFKNKKTSNFLKNLDAEERFYFIHSYYVNPTNEEEILAYYNFGGHHIPAIVSKNNMIGCQFHPEKSGKQGLNLISNFLKFE